MWQQVCIYSNYYCIQVAEALLDKTPKKLVPYTLTNSIQLRSKVGSLRFIGSGKIVASTDSEANA